MCRVDNVVVKKQLTRRKPRRRRQLPRRLLLLLFSRVLRRYRWLLTVKVSIFTTL